MNLDILGDSRHQAGQLMYMVVCLQLFAYVCSKWLMRYSVRRAMGVDVPSMLVLLAGVTGAGASVIVVGLLSINCLSSSLCFAWFDLGPCLIGDAKCFLKLNLEFSKHLHLENV